MTPKQPTVGGKVKQHSLGWCPPSTQQMIYILKQLSFYLPAHNTNDIFTLDMLFYLFIYLFSPKLCCEIVARMTFIGRSTCPRGDVLIQRIEQSHTFLVFFFFIE